MPTFAPDGSPIYSPEEISAAQRMMGGPAIMSAPIAPMASGVMPPPPQTMAPPLPPGGQQAAQDDLAYQAQIEQLKQNEAQRNLAQKMVGVLPGSKVVGNLLGISPPDQSSSVEGGTVDPSELAPPPGQRPQMQSGQSPAYYALILQGLRGKALQADKEIGSQMFDTFEQERQIANRKAQLEQTALATQEGLLRSGMEAQAKLNAEKQKQIKNAQHNVQDRFQRLGDAYADFKASKIDPENFWKNEQGQESFGRKIGGAIAIALSGIGNAIARQPGAPNAAIAMIERNIERNIDSQRSNLMQKRESANLAQSEYGLARQFLADEQSARLAAQSMSWEGVKQQAQIEAMKSQSPLVVENAKAFDIEVQKKIIGLQDQLSQRENQAAMQNAALGFQAAVAGQPQGQRIGSTNLVMTQKLQTADMGKVRELAGEYGSLMTGFNKLTQFAKEGPSVITPGTAKQLAGALILKMSKTMKVPRQMREEFQTMAKTIEDPQKIKLYGKRMPELIQNMQQIIKDDYRETLAPYGVEFGESSLGFEAKPK